METSNPAIPPKGATPGGNEQGAGTPPAAVSTPPQIEGQGNQQGGQVTISAKEYRNLMRDHARQVAFENRKGFMRSRNNPSVSSTPAADEDPELVEAFRKEQDGRIEAERKVLVAEVKVGISSILTKPEYAALPQSTKKFNPEKSVYAVRRR